MTNKKDDNRKQDFFRRLARGNDVDTAARCAGVNESELIWSWAKEYTEKEERTQFQDLESVQTAISTLKSLCEHAEEDGVRCQAARALLQFAKGTRPVHTESTTSSSVTLQKGIDLWDFRETE